ncbi:hypothetical protein ABW20_dc0103476 [Dactylellina cionopaga]|nr:hypothetical protein ABW20_dc0103476 [Dactylellina cionopaga]
MDSSDSPPPPGIDEPNQILLRGPSIEEKPRHSSPPPPPIDSNLDGTADKPTTTSGTAASAGDSNADPFSGVPPPLQKRRTSSFEYHDDRPSQYDSLKLLPRGSTKLSPLFLDLIRAKIREAERQLHFAILSSSTHDSHDASKRCSCALAELDYVRQRVILPPPIQLLDARILRSTALSCLQYVGEDRLLDAKKAENLIQRAFQVLGELVDWEEVKRRGAAVEMLEEFLPMCYFKGGKDKDGRIFPEVESEGQASGKDEKEEIEGEKAPKAAEGEEAEGEEGTVDFTETMAFWYQMMINHGRITRCKAEWKEQLHGRRAIKIENYAKAYKLFAVALQGLKEVYETSETVDTEYIDYKSSAEDGIQKILDVVVREEKQDELAEIISTTSTLDIEDIKLRIVKAIQRAQQKKEAAETEAAAGGDDKGKGKATPAYDRAPLSPKPISARDKGKGKAILRDEEGYKEKDLPAYSAVSNVRDKEDEWVIVEPKE